MIGSADSRTLAAMCALGLASPAGALTIPPILCDNANGSIADEIYVHGPQDEWLPGMTTFKRYRSAADDAPDHVIAHCASRKAVIYAGETMDEAAHGALRRAIEGDDAVTLGQLARRMRGMGVDAKLGTLGAGHCACDPATHRPSF